ncbi:MAG TPA: class I SAM-dependent methyltransferase [Syntrophomonadaceae bacterium]|nr:class I SAM-dependent methyltransferase [Syntrophomonadaceae bacterium]HOQ09126.1 class I SAM-dependent methyltransferase [Syntrophomonadaceae bacterium]HPU48924.1 class I SAM-dependent methyltransferase [Syntrophomonadaceae bacterium]
MFTGEIAANYDLWYQNPRGAFIDELETEAALKLFSPYPNQPVLDAGCGTGNFSIKLAQMGSKVTGIDISEDMLSLARNKASLLNLDIQFLKMDLHSLDFPDGSFAGVFSMAAWEFVTEPERAFAELWRVLRPGGQLLIGTINRESPWGKLYMEQAKQPGSVFRYADFKSLQDLKNLAPEHICGWSECLFIPPEAEDSLFTRETEESLRYSNSPGFIVVCWQKPL